MVHWDDGDWWWWIEDWSLWKVDSYSMGKNNYEQFYCFDKFLTSNCESIYKIKETHRDSGWWGFKFMCCQLFPVSFFERNKNCNNME